MRILMLAFLVLIAGAAEAHRVSLFVSVEGDTAHAEGYFPDGGACKDCQVEVLELGSGKKLLEGTTDEEGGFSFKLPGNRPLKVVLNAGMGHRDEYILRELETGPSNQEASTAESAREEIEIPDSGLRALDQVLEKRLKPVEQRLTRIEQRLSQPGMTEVIGGIGYIVGIFGIFLYLKGRGRR
jgi:nickel transport protein